MLPHWKNRIIIIIYTAVVITAIWIFVAHSAFLSSTIEAIDSSPSLASFVGDFIAGLFITILGTFLIPTYLDWRKRPKLEFKNRRTRTNLCELTKAQDGKWEGSFSLVIYNDGPVTQRDLYWHILVEVDDFDISVAPVGNTQPAGSELLVGNGKTWRHYIGKITDPVYPHRGLIFPHEIKIKSHSLTPPAYKIYYYITTEFGSSPARAEKFHEIERAIGRAADNAFKPEYLLHLEVKIEETK